jgi:hypothetical protein
MLHVLALALTGFLFTASDRVQTGPDITGTWVLVEAETLDRGPLMSGPADRNPTYGSRTVPAFGPEFTATNENGRLRVRQTVDRMTIDRDFDLTGKPTPGHELVVDTVNTLSVNGQSITLVVRNEAIADIKAAAVTRVLTLEPDGSLICVTSGVNGHEPMASRYKRK